MEEGTEITNNLHHGNYQVCMFSEKQNILKITIFSLKQLWSLLLECACPEPSMALFSANKETNQYELQYVLKIQQEQYKWLKIMKKISIVYPCQNLLNQVLLNSMLHVAKEKRIVLTQSDCESTGGKK